MSKREAFQSLGTILRNVRGDLSALSTDGRRAAVSLWQDDFRGAAGSMTYTLRDFGGWYTGAGVRLLFKHLAHALDNCDGFVHVVVAVQRRTGSGRERRTWFAREDLIMRVTYLDPATGSFRLEQWSPSEALAA